MSTKIEHEKENKDQKKKKNPTNLSNAICSRRPVGTVASALHNTLTAALGYDVTPQDKLQ